MNIEQALAIIGVATFLGGATLYFRSQALIKLQQAEIEAYKEKVDRLQESHLENRELIEKAEQRAHRAEERADVLKELFVEIVGEKPNGKIRRTTKKRSKR